jgi:hypothetical protein
MPSKRSKSRFIRFLLEVERDRCDFSRLIITFLDAPQLMNSNDSLNNDQMSSRNYRPTEQV